MKEQNELKNLDTKTRKAAMIDRPKYSKLLQIKKQKQTEELYNALTEDW